MQGHGQPPPGAPAYWPNNQPFHGGMPAAAPQPGYGQPQQGYYPPGQQPAPGMPPQGVPAFPQGTPPPLPTWEVDEAAMQAAAAAAEEVTSNWGKGKTEWFKVLPPEGYQNWKAAPPNTSRTHNLWICPPWQGSRVIYASYKKHRYMRAGQFSSIDCSGPGCLYCQARDLAAQYPNLNQSVENWGKRPQERYLYNVIDLDFPQLHASEDGQTMSPLVADFSIKTHKQIMDMVGPQGLVTTTALVDPQSGRPTRFTKKKTGYEDKHVEYHIQYAPNPSPLPQNFYWVLQNIHDLSQIRRTPTTEDYQKAIMALGWPMPQAPQAYAPSLQGPPTPAYSPQAAPPHQNPYGAPTGYPAPPMAAPVQPGSYAQPGYNPQPVPQYQAHPAPGYPAPGPMPAPPAPPTPPAAPASGSTAYSHPPGPPIPPSAHYPPGNDVPQAPPPMSPPAVTTQGGGAPAASYAPTPGGPAPGPAQQSPGWDDAPFNQAPATQPHALVLDPSTGKLPEGQALPDSRERCFGKSYAETDRMCQLCPDWIKSQCMPLCNAAAPGPDPELHQLTTQLEGNQSAG